MNPQQQQIKNNQNRQTWNLNEEKQPRRDWQRTMTWKQMKEGKGREKEKKKKNKKKKTRTRTTRRPITPKKAKKKESKREKEKEKGQQKGFWKQGFWQRKRKIVSKCRKNGVLGGYPKPNNHHLWSSLGHLMSLVFFCLCCRCQGGTLHSKGATSWYSSCFCVDFNQEL